MATRICPTCNIYLGDFDNYFCSNCGTELPENLSKLPGTIKIREHNSLQPLFKLPKKKSAKQPKPVEKSATAETNSLTEKTKKVHKRSFNEKMIYVLLAVVVGLILLFGAFYFFLQNKPIKQPVVDNTPQVSYKKRINLGLESRTVTFSTISALDYAPADALFYAEVADFNYFHDKVLSADMLKMEVGDYVKLKSLIKQDGFSIFAFKYNGKPYWVAVFTPSDPKKLQEELSSFTSTKFKTRIIGEKLVVFQNNANDNVIKTVESVYKGQSLKISLSPEYARAITQLNPSGQMRIIILNGEESSIIIKDLTTKYFGVQNELFTKLLTVKDTAFVVGQ
jgi:cell division protein FtsL